MRTITKKRRAWLDAFSFEITTFRPARGKPSASERIYKAVVLIYFNDANLQYKY